MSRLDALPPDQRAVVALLLQQGRSYDDIANVLGMPVSAVRSRAHAGVAALAPESGLPPEVTGLLADYLLGQQSAAHGEATRGLLAESASAQAWAAKVSRALAPEAPGGLPEVPGDRAADDGSGAADDQRDAEVAQPVAEREPSTVMGDPLTASGAGAEAATDGNAAVEQRDSPAGADAGVAAAATAGHAAAGDPAAAAAAGHAAGHDVAGRAAAAQAESAAPPMTDAAQADSAAPPTTDAAQADSAAPPTTEPQHASPPPAAPTAPRRAAPAAGPPPSSRLGGAVLIAGVLAIVVVVLIFVVRGGSGGGDKASNAPTATATATPTATPATAQVTDQIDLRGVGGSKARGRMTVFLQANRLFFQLRARNVPPSGARSAYAVWFVGPGSRARRLGYTDPVGADGVLGIQGPSDKDLAAFPRLYANYAFVVVSRETDTAARRPAEPILSGPLPKGR